METIEVICKLEILDGHFYMVSSREIGPTDWFLYSGNLKSGPLSKIQNYQAHLCSKIEASNDRALRNKVGLIHDGFGDANNFEKGKEYYFAMQFTPDGKPVGTMSGSVGLRAVPNPTTHA